MIHIDRTRIPPPDKLNNVAEIEAAAAWGYYNPVGGQRVESSYPFTAYRASGVRESLLELFHDKCAFCESKLNTDSPLEVQHFRPFGFTVNHDGSIIKPGYWWLAWEWSNLYPVCPLCNTTKANRFQVVGARAEFVQEGSESHTIYGETSSALQAIDVIANGELVMGAYQDGQLIIWDFESGKTKAVNRIDIEMLSVLAATPDGSTVVAGSDDGLLIICKLSKKYSLQQSSSITSNGGKIRAVAVSPDGSFVISGSDTFIHVFDAQTGEIVHEIEAHPDWIKALTVTPDGRKIVSAGVEGTVGIWDLETGEEIRILVGEIELVGVGVTSDGTKVVSLSDSGLLEVWDLENGERQFSMKAQGQNYERLTLSADGRFAACGGAHVVVILDLHTRQQREMIDGTDLKITDTALVPNGRYCLTADRGGVLRIWNLYSAGVENALLLDPCQDEPSKYLVFNDDGFVASAPLNSDSPQALHQKRFKDFDRGQITIDTFGLNRVDLVEERKHAAQELENELYEIFQKFGVSQAVDQEEIQATIDEFFSARFPFAAMRRQLIPKIIEEIQSRLEVEETVSVLESTQQKIEEFEVKGDVIRQAFVNLDELSSQRMTSTIEDEEISEVVLRSSLISRVTIENYKCINYLTFDFSGGSKDRVGWKVLLGDNGVGKSSVLEAVALTVMGNKRLVEFSDIDQTSLLKRGTEAGFVKVYFSTDTQPIELKLTSSGFEYISPETSLRTYMLGFGSARWLPGPGSADPEIDPYVRVRNLFNPFVPLTDAIQWLIDLKRERRIHVYQKVEAVLARLLQLELGTRFPLRDEHGKDVILVQRPGQPISGSERLDQLSDGYQTVLAIAVAIMDMLGKVWDMEMEAAEGLVLLDEIGAHLHPGWKLRIVENLRNAFPRMQFLSATHEPLCLRGLYDNEILLLRKDDGKVRSTDNIESPDTLSIDQLLLSPLFGLLSTFDPDTERDLELYYELISKPESKHTKGDLAELKVIRQRLGQAGVLSEMAIKQVALQVIDDRISEDEELDVDSLKPETKDVIADIWDNISTGEGSAR